MPPSVARELERAYQASAPGHEQHAEIPLELSDRSTRLIVFSDHHRGARDRADDFRKCEAAYNGALAHYLAEGYTLIALGDAEELWENRPGQVLSAYDATLRLEARFHAAGRYLRFWGNHDDEWRHQGAVEKALQPLGLGCPVWESLRMPVTHSGQPVGTLFFVHGHQGTLESDRFGAVSRFFVRWLWRPLQRLTGASATTPATDYELRQGHDGAMYDWAARKGDGLVLITGHTHRPVFESLTHLGQLRIQLREVEEMLAEDPDSDTLQATRRTLQINIAHRLAAEGLLPEGEEPPPSPVPGRRVATPLGTRALNTPCYFNTGCCSFPDGDVTGIEIADGAIRLVRWPDDEGNLDRPKVLAQAEVLDILVRSGGRAELVPG